MNRREALRKLGASGAIATGASLVVLSSGVAHAASGGIGPLPKPTVVYSYTGNALKITLNAPPPTCGLGTPTPSYSWSNPGPTVVGGPRLGLSGSNGNSVVVVRTGNPAQNSWGDGLPVDVFSVDVTVTWGCAGVNAQRTYTVMATIPNPATVTP